MNSTGSGLDNRRLTIFDFMCYHRARQFEIRVLASRPQASNYHHDRKIVFLTVGRLAGHAPIRGALPGGRPTVTGVVTQTPREVRRTTGPRFFVAARGDVEGHV